MFSVLQFRTLQVSPLCRESQDIRCYSQAFLGSDLSVAIEREYAIQVALPTPSQSVRIRSGKCLSRTVHLALFIVSAIRSQLYPSQPVYLGFQEDHTIRIRRMGFYFVTSGKHVAADSFYYSFPSLYTGIPKQCVDIYQSVRLSTFYKYSTVYFLQVQHFYIQRGRYHI